MLQHHKMMPVEWISSFLTCFISSVDMTLYKNYFASATPSGVHHYTKYVIFLSQGRQKK
jgi:hypothetical protein